MKISTDRIKEAVNKAISGSTKSGVLPLTNMIGIKLYNGKLRFLTTDMENKLCLIIDKVQGDSFDITVDVERFSKLVSKTTSETMELSVDQKNDVLLVKGNGSYKIPLEVDENGLVSFPDIEIEKEATDHIKLSSVMQAYNINKSALCKDLTMPSLTGYYCGERVITTDSNVITFNGFKMFENSDSMLLSAQQMHLLTLNTVEDIAVNVGKSRILFMTDNVVIDCAKMEGIEDFPVDDINAYLDEAFESSCVVPKDLLVSILDRLSLFIEPYDRNGAYFSFGRKGLDIRSKKDASIETLAYIESDNFKPFVCCVDIPMLKEQLQANPSDSVHIFYGNENALKIQDGKITQVIALLEDEDLDKAR